MSAISSILFGSESSTNFLGINLNFKCQEGHEPSYFNRAFGILTLGYSHTFVHEMCHAFAHKLFSNNPVRVDIDPSQYGGHTRITCKRLSDWKNSLCAAAGPLGNLAFSVLQILGVGVLTSYLSWPVSAVLIAGNVIWMTYEILYGAMALDTKNGDLHLIASRSMFHLMITGVAMVALYSFGLFAAYHTLKCF